MLALQFRLQIHLQATSLQIAEGAKAPNAFRIAFIDIETAPNLGYTWGKYEQTVLSYERERYMLSFSVKWSDKKRVEVYGLPDYPNYKKNRADDSALCRALWDVLNNADLVVAHNGDRFDLRVANARFLVHGFPPPEPYKTADTLKIVKKYFSFNSNKLDDICKVLGIGSKIHTGGFQLWLDVMAGDEKAWKKMKDYNKHDVVLLEAVYNKLKAWHVSHPNIAIKMDGLACPACGSKDIAKRGFAYTATTKTQRYNCNACGHWSTASKLANSRTSLKGGRLK